MRTEKKNRLNREKSQVDVTNVTRTIIEMTFT
jgi:hypothetical protein